MKSVGQAINIDWTIGLSLFLITTLSAVIIISQPELQVLDSSGIQNKLAEISSNLEEETYIEGRKTNLYVRTPVELEYDIPVNQPHIFHGSTAKNSGSMNTTSNINVSGKNVKAVIEGSNSTYEMSHYEESILDNTSTTNISTNGDISNSLITVNPENPGLTSLQIEGNELLNDNATFQYTDYSTEKKTISASTFDGNLTVYEETPEIIVEDTQTTTFYLKNLSTLYWENDNSTTPLEGQVSKSNQTKGFTVASNYGISFIGDLDANVTKSDGSDVVKAEIETDRLRIMLHNSDYVEGWKRAKTYKEGEIYFGVSEKIRGATRENIRELNTIGQQELEKKLELGNQGYNITFGFAEAAKQKFRTIQQYISNQGDWNKGSYTGTSADRKNNSGTLGIGYRDGSAGIDLTKGLVGYWRMDRESGNVIDYSGEGNDGIPENGVNRGVNGTFSTQSFDFDGTDDYVDTGISDNIQTGDFSLSLWINPDSRPSSGQRLVEKDSGGNGWALSYGDPGQGRLRFFVRGMDTVSLDTSDLINVGNWYHLTAVFDDSNNNRYIYVNGERRASDTDDTGSPSTNTNSIALGAEADNETHYDGKLDEIRIYNRSLSNSDVEDLYFKGKNGKFEGNYTSNRFGDNDEKNWTELEINASVPDETALSAQINAYNEFGNQLGRQNLVVQEGLKNYSIGVRDSEQLELGFNGTSENASKSWEVQSSKVFIDPANNLSLLNAGNNIPFTDTFVRDTESLIINRTGGLEPIQNKVVVWR
ncbi:MAG: hypothetical protein BRC29_02155 [Nanohaloarchaea archaeon SW_7_43_1]|nr:MAG: hypothetical protein BRC29_02155 [Nanohaloarchaea archaeon SW_7_43_1]